MILSLFGKTIRNVLLNLDNNSVTFKLNKTTVQLYHEQDADEIVTLDDVEGNLDDLMNTQVLEFSKSTNSGMEIEDMYGNMHAGSFTWSIYKIVTQKGTVRLKWLITSDGLDCEQVSLRYIN